MRDNDETLAQIDIDANEEKKTIKDKNDAALKNVQSMSLMSTAELQNKKNKL